ncbi:MAG TPA: RNA polymerase sigma factor [Thermoleophilaceae bacterium]|nr:RNA polymerase sigma factor [Thermoleophilaceae bacterium]
MAVRLPPFQALLDEHRADVYRFLVASLGRDDADDCFQETFISALRAYPRLRDASNLRSWLFTIAHRKAIDAHRARGRRATPVEDLPERAAPTGPELNGEPELWAEVRRLPNKQRAAVLHRFVNDLAYADIGQVMGCSEDAARRSVHEGLKKLRTQWAT